MCLGRFLVELSGLTLLDGDRAFRAMSDASAKAVTIDITDEFGLAIYDLDGSFGTGDDALPAAIALFFVDSYYVS
jgi:hypothetical protein